MKKQTSLHKRRRSAKTNCARIWCAILGLGIFLAGCMRPGEDRIQPSVATAEFTFQREEIITGTAKQQTVLTGFLLGGHVAEIVVVNGDRGVRIYAFDEGTWRLKLEATLRLDVLFVDVAHISGRDRLITYEPGRLNWFEPESATEYALAEVTSIKPPPGGPLPHVDITHDVNGDGLDDLVVPDFDGFWICVQLKDSAFTEPMKLGTSTEEDSLFGGGAVDGYRHQPWTQSRIHEMDYNQDGRIDLGFWNETRFEVHLQNAQGLFNPEAETFTTEVAFDSDLLTSLAAPHETRQRQKDHGLTGKMTGSVLHAFTDMNGDNIADLGVFSLHGDLWNMHATYAVHFGNPTPDGGTVFAPEASTELLSDGIQFGMAQHDFDFDGQSDMMFTTLKPRVFKAIGMIIDSLVTGAVSMELTFYRMEDSSYPAKPTTSRSIRVETTGKSGGRSRYPSVLIGDVNGDKRADLLVQHGEKELRVFLGIPGPALFAKRPQKVKVEMPHEEYTWLVTLNKDGKQDVLMHHPSATKPHRVTLLIAR